MDEQNAQTDGVFGTVSPKEEEEEEEEAEEEEDQEQSYSTRERHLRRGVYTLYHTLYSICATLPVMLFFYTLPIIPQHQSMVCNSCLTPEHFSVPVSVCKPPCEKLIAKGSLSAGSSASLPAQTGGRENMLNAKILYPGKSEVKSRQLLARVLLCALH